jgi:hypothetical protein
MGGCQRIARAAGIDLYDSIVSLDGVYDCWSNRKAIFNRGMIPNINPILAARDSSARTAAMSSTICRRRAGGSAAQRSFRSMLIAFETFDR